LQPFEHPHCSMVRTGLEPCQAWPVRSLVRLSHGEVVAGYFNHGVTVMDQGREAGKESPARSEAIAARKAAILTDPAERKALDKAAEAEDRSAAYVARRAITEWLKEKGFLK